MITYRSGDAEMRSQESTSKPLNVQPSEYSMVDVISKAFKRAGLSSGNVQLDHVNFVERGNFTLAEIYYMVSIDGKSGSWVARDGAGFAHRMQGDKRDKSIGRARALTRAIKDSLTPEELA